MSEADKNVISTKNSQTSKEKLERFKAGAFFISTATVSAIVGFSYTIMGAKRNDPHFFNKGVVTSVELADHGAFLAMRALGWGTFYAVTGSSLFFYGIWKLSGAKDLKEFRYKMGNILPRIPKNDPPQSRTEFSGLNDLLTYVSTEKFGKS